MPEQLTPRDLAALLAAPAPAPMPPTGPAADTPPTPQRPLLLDVREPWEHALCQLPDSLLLPMRRVPSSLDQLDPSRQIVVICHHGIRSQQVALFLEHRGFDRVSNLAGGIEAWARDLDPKMRRY